MKPIKFRGRCIGNGNVIRGNLEIDFDEVFIEGWQVDPESVAQLVGFDADDREVYEGDALINERGDEFFAELTSAVLTDEGFLHADIPLEILKVKEAQS